MLQVVARNSWRGVDPQLLVSEFIDGCFLVDMQTRGLFHGEQDVFNALWDGERWVVVGAKGFRGPLHRLRPEGLITKHWRLISSNLMRICGVRLAEVRSFFDT